MLMPDHAVEGLHGLVPSNARTLPTRLGHTPSRTVPDISLRTDSNAGKKTMPRA